MEIINDKLEKQEIRICPNENCHQAYERPKNQNFIECKCDLTWCFECSIYLNPIKAHDNSYHRQDCILFQKSIEKNQIKSKKCKEQDCMQSQKSQYLCVNELGHFCLNCIKQGKKGCSRPELTYNDFIQQIFIMYNIGNSKEDKQIKKVLSKYYVEDPKQYYGIDLPDEWEDQQQDVQLFELNKQGQEFLQIQTLFQQTVQNRKIVKIQRIQSKALYRNYIQEVRKMENDHLILNRGQQQNIAQYFQGTKQLWHGTRHTNPDRIYGGIQEGFDASYGNEGCMWGQGAYFAVNSSYSVAYSYKSNQNTYQFLLCEVNLGYCKDMPSKKYQRPPFIDDQKPELGSFDCIQGYTNGSVIYILYQNAARRSYPSYLVDFQ